MKTSFKNFIIVEILMLFVIVLSFFISNIFTNFGLILFLSITLCLLIYLFGIELKIQINEKKVILNITICLLIYLIVIYLLGLFIGFNKTIYNYNLTNLTHNIIPIFIIMVLIELIRYQIIKKSNNKYIIIASILIFLLLDVASVFHAYDLSNVEELKILVGYVILGGISKNIFLTISMCKTGFANNIVYRTITELYIYLVPIVPAFDPYVKASIAILLPLILCFVIINTTKFKKNENKVPNKKYNKVLVGIIFSFLIVIMILNAGFFKYKSLTIGSNSMKPYMSKGDIIIIEKYSKNEIIDKIKKGEILIYNYKNKLIAHRVYEVIGKNDTVYFKTKGDNNEQVDTNLVNVKDVIGVSKIRIKYLGLGSVWLQELIG